MSRLSRVSKGLLRCDCALLAVANASPALERAEHEVTYKERERVIMIYNLSTALLLAI